MRAAFRLRFKEANAPSEFDQIHRLNHRIFAEEVPQHPVQSSGLLIDRWHHQNRYFVAMRGETVIGMISASGGPEFSITKRLPHPGLLSQFDRPLEIRLLAIEPEERKRTVMAGLFWQVYDYAVSHGYSHLLISGISTRQSMYRRLDFVPLGPAVREGAAEFVPMAMAVARGASRQSQRAELYERRCRKANESHEPVSLLPGPVCIHPSVTAAFASAPISHRSALFRDRYRHVLQLLNGLANGSQAVLFNGAGTLANDSVAANLKAVFRDDRGLVISNGEFGERLARQASRAGLTHRWLRFDWGMPWDPLRIREAMAEKPAWIWCVQLETSTGVLNDIQALLSLAAESKSCVALDCVSSSGAVEIWSEQVEPPLFATGVSGKSLGSYTGLAFVYLSAKARSLLRGKVLCPSFDLLAMHEANGPVSTVSSPLLFAFAEALERSYSSQEAICRRFEEYRILGCVTRAGLKSAGLKLLASDDIAAPNIATFTLPSNSFPDTCLRAGYRIAFESAYLRARGWGQIATMGNIDPQTLHGLFEFLKAEPSIHLAARAAYPG